MIKEFEFYHGATFARILHATDEQLAFKRYPTVDNAAYVINDRVGLYIKYSSKRMPPWRFSFQMKHQDEIASMRDVLDEVFVLLVCHDDGIVALSFDELKRVLDEDHGPTEWISASRTKRTMYAIAGSNGKLDFKVGKHDFPAKIFAKLIVQRAQSAAAIP
jgi:hypothetical protein